MLSRIPVRLVSLSPSSPAQFIESSIHSGCEHNGKFFNDGDRIPNAESPCYSCYCQGSSITCALADCKFRFDCEPEYIPGECCPRYDHCPPEPTKAPTTTMSTTYSPAPVFIPITTTTTTTAGPSSTTSVTTSIPPVEVVPTSSEVVNETENMHHNETTVKPVTELPLTVSNETNDSSSLLTTVTSKIEMDEEVTSKKPATELFELKPATDVRKGADQLEKAEVFPVKVEDGIASGIIEVVTSTESTSLSVEDNFPTTKTWIPDTSLNAEHKDSNDQNILPEAVTLSPQFGQPTTVGGPLVINKTSEEAIIPSSSPTPYPSPTLEPIEEVSLTTSSDNVTIM